MKARIFWALCLAGAAVLPAGPAQAEVTLKDLQIMARALSFADKAPTGDVNVGIVYAPDNAASAKEAESIKALLGDGLKVGNLVLKPVLVKVDDAAGADVAAFITVEGLGAAADKVKAATAAKQKPCITTDIPTVQSGACAMGIKSEPKVEIIVNKTAAAATGMSFVASFRMMITEL